MQKKINKKKVIILILLVLSIIISAIVFILAKYRSSAENNDGVDIAYYIVDGGIQSDDLILDAMAPNAKPYIYKIKVSNYKDEKVAETALTYTLKIKATTNLPLIYNIYLKDDYDKKGTEATSQIKKQETTKEGGVYYYSFNTEEKEIGLEKTDDVYALVVDFPVKYKKSMEYTNILEYLKVTIDSKQKI